MAKFCGYIGFVKSTLVRPGVMKNVAIERKYRGDIRGITHKWEPNDHLNDDLGLDNTLSIVADSYITENLYAIRYVKMMGAAWRITRVREQYPRLILTIGGIYNGQQAEPTGET